MSLIFVGIDVAYRTNGTAVCIFKPYNKEFIFIVFKSVANLILNLTKKSLQHNGDNTVFYIENSAMINANFDKTPQTNEAHFKKGLCVGKNQATSKLLIFTCKVCYPKSTIKEISPYKKGSKFKTRKDLEAYLFDVLGFYPKLTFQNIETQDCYDAAKLSFLAYSETIKL
jgi:hypothetical protein